MDALVHGEPVRSEKGLEAASSAGDHGGGLRNSGVCGALLVLRRESNREVRAVLIRECTFSALTSMSYMPVLLDQIFLQSLRLTPWEDRRALPL